MKTRIASNAQALGITAAQIVARQVRRKAKPVLMLPTGETPLPMYDELVSLHQRRGLSFARAVFFNLDEYCDLPENHPQSYHTYMRRNIFSRVDANPSNIHILNGNATDLVQECVDFERQITLAGGVDLAVLGLGRNGHVAFVEPPASLESRTHVALLSESTRQANSRFFGAVDDVPRRAVTVGLRTVLDSRKILILASGEEKALAVARATQGPLSEACPASALQTHPAVTFLVDEAAASRLQLNLSSGTWPAMIAEVGR